MSKPLTLSASIAVLSMALFVAIVAHGHRDSSVTRPDAGAPAIELSVSR